MLFEQITQQDVLEWFGLLTGIVYVLLATYERPSCWVFGIISSACIAWKSFTDYLLFADGILQVFYIIIGVVGLWHWMRGSSGGLKKKVMSSPLRQYLISILLCVLLSWPLSWLLMHYTIARYGYVDTLLMLLSVWATILLIRKDIHNWLFWIVIDTAYVVLYFKTEGYLFALLFAIYAVISVWGWLRWRKELIAYLR